MLAGTKIQFLFELLEFVFLSIFVLHSDDIANQEASARLYLKLFYGFVSNNNNNIKNGAYKALTTEVSKCNHPLFLNNIKSFFFWNVGYV